MILKLKRRTASGVAISYKIKYQDIKQQDYRLKK